jgi:hypothetical protein
VIFAEIDFGALAIVVGAICLSIVFWFGDDNGSGEW